MKPFILIGSFDPSDMETWCRAAQAEGFEAVAARDGDEILTQLHSRSAPALVVAGASLPRADAFEVLRELRLEYGPEEVPALVTSPFPLLRLAASALRDSLGIADVLGGRLDGEECAASIRRAVARVSPPFRPEDAARRSSRVRRKETTRLHRIETLGLDRELPHDAMLQQLVEDAACAFKAPIALLSVVLQDRTHFLAHAGLDSMLASEPGLAFEWPFCRLVVEEGRELIVPEASRNPVFAGNRLVKDGHVRGYAGTPVMAPGGETLGTLAVASTDRLSLSAADVDRLGTMARRVAGEMETRAVTKRAEEDADRLGSALGAQEGPATLMATLATARTALEAMDSGVILMDSQRRVVYANAAACDILDAPVSQLLGMTRERLVGQGCSLVECVDDFLRQIRVTPSGPYVGRADFVFVRPVRRAIRWVGRPVLLPSGLGQLTILSDVTAESELVEVRRRFACVDSLTGLPNRRAGIDMLTREIARAARAGEPLALALFDLDGLRFVNRDHGSDAGDRLLQRTAATLTRSAREADALVRWSGEEFLLILPACRAAEASQVAENAARELESPELEEAPGITLSAGVTEWRRGEGAEEVIYRAEEQLRKAKTPGGGT